MAEGKTHYLPRQTRHGEDHRGKGLHQACPGEWRPSALRAPDGAAREPHAGRFERHARRGGGYVSRS
eukprot:4595014-Pyramimonas_sp.AAC.1